MSRTRHPRFTADERAERRALRLSRNVRREARAPKVDELMALALAGVIFQ